MTCETCRDLLNEALNLACRSDQFEEQRRRQAALDASSDAEAWLESGRFDAYVERYNLTHPLQRKSAQTVVFTCESRSLAGFGNHPRAGTNGQLRAVRD